MQTYESEWYYSTVVDILEKPDRMALLLDDATEEQKQNAITAMRNFITKCDSRWADGRAHIAGDKITHADFAFLAIICGWYDNPNGKHVVIREASLQVGWVFLGKVNASLRV